MKRNTSSQALFCTLYSDDCCDSLTVHHFDFVPAAKHQNVPNHSFLTACIRELIVFRPEGNIITNSC